MDSSYPNNFLSMLETGRFHDAEIRCKDGSILGIHRLMLCLHSEYYREMLSQVHELANRIIIFAPDCEPSDIENIREYMYKGELLLSPENVEGFALAAKTLRIDNIDGVVVTEEGVESRDCTRVEDVADMSNVPRSNPSESLTLPRVDELSVTPLTHIVDFQSSSNQSCGKRDEVSSNSRLVKSNLGRGGTGLLLVGRRRKAIATSTDEQILKQTSRYLTPEDISNCKLVCQAWRLWASSIEGGCKASLVFHIPHVVEKIFKYLNLKQKLESRLISESFDLVASKQLSFKPTLTEITKNSIMNMGPDLRVDEIRVVGLYTALPVDDEGKLKCSTRLSSVKSLSFFEGVAAINKTTLLKSLPYLQELRFISTTNHASVPGGANLYFLRVLEIRTSVYDESESLTSFFTNESFPSLEEVDFNLYTRLDFFLYLQVHRFIASHLKQLKKMKLSFQSDFTFARDNVINMLKNFPAHLNEMWLEVAETFASNENILDCRFRFIRCEGISRFRLTTILFDNQRRLNPNAVLLFHGPDNLEDREETEDEDEDEEDMPNEEIEDEVPDEHAHVEYRYELPSGINERMEIQNGTDQLDSDGDESDQDFEAGQEQEQGDDMDSGSSGDGEMEDNELPELMADVQTEPDLEADTDADEQ